MNLETIEKKLRISLLATACVAAAAVAFYFIWFGIVLEEPLSKSTGTWGELGDFLGGLMNPIVAGCALYWLAMSVRLQKQELSDTRHELAAASRAQREQARMALLGIQLNSVSLQLNATTTELTYAQSKMSYLWQRMDGHKGYGVPEVFDVSAGKRIEATILIEELEEKMTFLHDERAKLFGTLEQINDLALAEQTESADDSRALT